MVCAFIAHATQGEKKMTEIENATITNTFLGYEDHGFLTFSLTVQGSGWGVAIGNIALDEYDSEKEKRVPHPKSMEVIADILRVVGVDCWEKLEGQHIRVQTNGLGGRVSKFGNLIEEKWLDVDTYFGKEDQR